MNSCPRCPKSRFFAPPTGPTPADILILNEVPSKDDDKWGAPLIGRIGKEFDHTYLPLLGVPRSSLYIMNSVMCSRKDYSIPDPIDAESCMSTHLGPILAQVLPKIIVPMGAVPCSIFPEINLPRDHGLPIPGNWGSVWQGILFPTYNPAVGLRMGGMMIALMNDFHALGQFYRQIREFY